MAGGHGHGPKSYSGPIDIHPPRPLYRYSNLILGASMWFWIMYRLKEDGPVLFGFRHPWEGHHGPSHAVEHKKDEEHH
ncbi:hypothetical protein BZA70DRAFT_287684 [Myxozyma melibiosi]|uniref:NADH dehydrogenase [ubiquinone] 1 beta subcomplex subunit 2 n=1 Tax=Myxozyma melibiosi TaxID=54550 RepID=A0ABR1FF52_9ASCO